MYAWRLLVRISYGRWLAIALSASDYILNRQPGGRAGSALAAVTVCAVVYNTAIAAHRYLPRWAARRMAVVTVAGDFIWVTIATAASLTAGGGASTVVAGYVTVALECGLLLGWRGALTALTGTVVILVGLELTVTDASTGSGDRIDAAYQAGTIGVAAMLAAIASSELRSQHQGLVAQAASLARYARTDHLTGLGNTWAFNEATASLAGQPFGLLLVDVDGMRQVNDVYGHEAGDEVLHAVAGVLAGVCGPADSAARLAEDKFVVVLRRADEARTWSAAERVLDSAHRVASSSGPLRVSIGCAWSPPGTDPADVLSRADDALFAAKGGGGDRIVAQGAAQGSGRWRLRAAVESVLASDRGVYSVYQRVIRLDDRETVGWEALSRPHGWPPGTDVEALFLTAHRLGRARDLDWRCRRNALWEASRLPDTLFVNVNIAALVDPVHDVDQMLLICEWAGRSPRSVVLELSERDTMPDLARLRHVMSDYRAAGFRFAVDDIGEGRTTLELVLAARPEFLKLARQLIQSARRHEASRSATHGLVVLAHDMGSTVIAEGVEDEADHDLCVSLDMDLGQGWLYGRPQPSDSLRSSIS
jgi:diguanylate cyclase (GGDEF)-like protein